MMSKVAIAYALALVTLAVSGRKDRLHQIHEECQADPATRVDEETIQKALKGEDINDPALGLHVLCMNIKGGFQHQNGDIIQEGLRTFLDGKMRNLVAVERIISECGRNNGGTAQEAAVALAKCLNRYALEHHKSHAHDHHKFHGDHNYAHHGTMH